MSRNTTLQRGFSAVEAVIIVLIIAALGFVGWMVYNNKHRNAQKQVTVTKTDSGSSNVDATASDTPNYFTISQWGVRAPYTGNDTFTYTLAGAKLATIASGNLAEDDQGCKTYGAGQIKRLSPSDPIYPNGPTVEVDAQQNPGAYGHVANYYYFFVHDQSACGSSTSPDAQNIANNEIMALVPTLQAIPR